MRTVWKFPFKHFVDLSIRMPEGAIPVMVDVQEGIPTLWVEVETSSPEVVRLFEVYGTGVAIREGMKYVGSFHSPPLVWHLYEEV